LKAKKIFHSSFLIGAFNFEVQQSLVALRPSRGEDVYKTHDREAISLRSYFEMKNEKRSFNLEVQHLAGPLGVASGCGIQF